MIQKSSEVINPFGINYIIKRYGKTVMNDELKRFIIAKNNHINMTADWDNYDLFEWRKESPGIEDLNGIFVDMVKEWMKANSWFNGKPQFTFKGWANIRNQDSYHNLHSHNDSQLSLNYYVATPPGSCIEFINPDSSTCAVKGAD